MLKLSPWVQSLEFRRAPCRLESFFRENSTQAYERERSCTFHSKDFSTVQAWPGPKQKDVPEGLTTGPSGDRASGQEEAAAGRKGARTQRGGSWRGLPLSYRGAHSLSLRAHILTGAPPPSREGTHSPNKSEQFASSPWIRQVVNMCYHFTSQWPCKVLIPISQARKQI